MHRTYYYILCFWAWVGLVIASSNGQTPAQSGTPVAARYTPVSEREVMAALRRGVNYLFSTKGAINWETKAGYAEDVKHHGAETAIVVYALLQTGKSLDDPRLKAGSPELKPAIAWLEELKADSTYVGSLQATALALAPRTPGNVAALSRLRELFLKSCTPEATYSYDLNGTPPTVNDNSNTQYAIMGMWAISEAGLEVPPKYWAAAQGHWLSTQKEDGGWGYQSRIGGSTLSMTSAGLASLALIVDQGWDLGVLGTQAQGALEKGQGWLKKNFVIDDTIEMYSFYAIERAGLATGLKHLGDTEWYQGCARYLLARQQAAGEWKITFGLNNHDPRFSTAYALLFLTRGGNAIAFNKLQFEAGWNTRPRDQAHLAHWITNRYERAVNWQIVNMNSPVEEWLDAPVLYFSAKFNPGFTAEQVEKLRQYIQAGGLIFTSSAEGSPEFTETVKLLAREVMADQSREGGAPLEMRELPPEHPLFRMNVKFDKTPQVWAISNGLREVWIHVPEDLSDTWQRNVLTKQNQWEIAGNVMLYATGKARLLNRLQTTVVIPAKETPIRTLVLGRLEYEGNWDPEPGAFVRLSKLAQAEYRMRLVVQPLGIDDLAPPNSAAGAGGVAVPVLHFTGTGKFSFTPAQVARLKAYLDGGGILWAEAAGGDKEFGESVQKLVGVLYPTEQLETLGVDSDLLSGAFPEGKPLVRSLFRAETLRTFGKMDAPRLQVLTHQGRMVVLYSPLDMLSGVMGTNTWGILGYQPETAEGVARNILLYLYSVNAPKSPARK